MVFKETKITNIVAVILLALMFCLAVFSMKDDSATMDEVAHIPAGYSYLTQKDMRLNPEHPPLLKDLAAIPLLFIKGISFPSGIKDWQEDVNGQWGFGYHFLYQAGNPADQMIFWSRLPMILVLVLLGFYIFKWTRELFGRKAALLALFLFSFSPTFLAHGRLVTTDVGAAAGVFIATYYFISALKNPIGRNIVFAGIAFGLAQLCKFSVILLVPFFLFLGLIWWIIKLRNWRKTLRVSLLVFLVGFILIWSVYQFHVWNYPPERQVQDTHVYLQSLPAFIQKPLTWASSKPALRPYAHYFTGLAMAMHRAGAGHTTYFLGQISNLGWKNYFPIVYAIKEPLAFHILTLIALLYAAWLIDLPPLSNRKKLARRITQKVVGGWQKTGQRLKGWVKSHFPEFAMLIFIGLYWIVSLKSNLNIGLRHLLPVFPFTFVLISGSIIHLLNGPICTARNRANLIRGVLLALILWQIISVISIYPHFLAYFNELVGGPDKGYIYTVDSNLDWGQDLKRLDRWVKNKGLDRIYVDYFGGGDVQYYLKEKFVPWWGQRDPAELPKGSYLAVSATFLQGGRGEPAPGFDQPTRYYQWLYQYKPVAKIGYSIFIYHID